jgi:hypothetical protein
MMTLFKTEGIDGSLLEDTVPILYTFGVVKAAIRTMLRVENAATAHKKRKPNAGRARIYG